MKYIVYKTTNLVNSYIYVGIHKTKDPDIFDGYLGNGVYINKPDTYKYSKTNFQIAVNTYGIKNFKRENIAVFDTESEALLLESLIVNEEFLSKPYVYNMILGGSYDLAKSIKCYQYDLNGNYISEFDSMTSAANSINKSFQGISKAIMFKTKCGDYYWSTDKVEKLNTDVYNKVNPIKVYRYLINSGKFDKEYDSLSSAAEDTNTFLINVSRSAKLGYRVDKYQFSFIKKDYYADAKTEYLKTRPVYKYDKEGNFLKAYNTQEEAEKENKFSNITSCIKNKKECVNGFRWGLEKMDHIISLKSKKVKIGQFDENDNLIAEFNSIKECCEKTGVSRAYITIGKKWKNYYFHAI